MPPNAKKCWNYAVLSACLRQADGDTRKFTNQNLIKQELSTIVKDTQTVGKTPANTMSKILQDLRDAGLVTFEKAGHYQLNDIQVTLDELIRIKQLIKNGCRMSKGERMTAMILKIAGLDFEQEKIFGDLKHKNFLRFDFYFEISGRGFLIEFDGEQHRRPIDHFGGQAAFDKLQHNDKLKDEFVKQRTNLHLIRLSTCKLEVLSKQLLPIIKNAQNNIFPPAITKFNPDGSSTIEEHSKTSHIKGSHIKTSPSKQVCTAIYKSGCNKGQQCSSDAEWLYLEKQLCSRHCNKTHVDRQAI
jgi:hypothetical protein